MVINPIYSKNDECGGRECFIVFSQVDCLLAVETIPPAFPCSSENESKKKEELKSTTIVANFVSHLRTPHQAKVPSRQSSSREVQLPPMGGTILPRTFPWKSFGFGKSRNFYCHYLLLARNEISQLFGFWNTLKIVFKWWSLRKIINSELENLNIFLFFDYSEKMHYLGR